MLSSKSSHTITVKARSMYGKRLTQENYSEMLRRNSVTDIAAYLKDNTSYSAALDQIEVHSIHRGQLESILMREQFNKYIRLRRYNFTGDSDFYNYLIVQHEIEQILKCVLSLNAGSMESFILDLPTFLIEHASFDLLAIAKVRSFNQLLDVLKKSHYHKVILPFAKSEGEPIDYAACEKALMMYHYSHLLGAIQKRFSGATKRDLERVVKVNISLMNLMIIYRLKRYFEASSDEIRNSIFPYNFKLNPALLQKLIDAPSIEEFFEEFEQSYYGMNNQIENSLAFEHHLQEIIYKYNKKLLRFSTSSPAVMYAFIILNGIEVKNVTRIIEGTRYQVPSSQIEQLLIL